MDACVKKECKQGTSAQCEYVELYECEGKQNMDAQQNLSKIYRGLKAM